MMRSKKALYSLLAVCLLICMLFVSCASSGGVSTGGSDTKTNNSAGSNESSGGGNSGKGDGSGSGNGGNGDGGGNGPTNDEYTRVEKTVTFGSYPQTKVESSALISALNSTAGALPTSSDAKAWTDYGYWSSSSISSYMWYIDVEHEGAEYRGVYFTSYRPENCHTSSNLTPSNNQQYINSYETGTVYWFKYEPIRWTIVHEASGKALLVCDMILDAQQFDQRKNAQATNDYSVSSIRAWLNESFYTTAFTASEQAILVKTTVDNGLDGEKAKTTDDFVFLLSSKEADSYFAMNDDRKKSATDYTFAQGIKPSDSGDVRWWLRSSAGNTNYPTEKVVQLGKTFFSETVWYINVGVVPAVVITL